MVRDLMHLAMVGNSPHQKVWLVVWDQWKHQDEVLDEEGRAKALLDLPHIDHEIHCEPLMGLLDLPVLQHIFYMTYEARVQTAPALDVSGSEK